MNIGIVGAGMAGLSCADQLVRFGHRVTLFDKGRGAGGRTATRRIDAGDGPVAVDFGAPFFTANQEEFVHKVRDWEGEGLVTRWPDPHGNSWTGIPTMNAIVRTMVERHEVHFSCLVKGMEARKDGWRLLGDGIDDSVFDAVVIAIPMEQAMGLVGLHDIGMARRSLTAISYPCWVGLLLFSEPVKSTASMLKGGPSSAIDYAISNRTKPHRSNAEAWTVYASQDWSSKNVDMDRQGVADHLQQALAELLGSPLPAPVMVQVHRWLYAGYEGERAGPMWNPRLGLGLCGDWVLGDGLEDAWISGRMLADRILTTGAFAA